MYIKYSRRSATLSNLLLWSLGLYAMFEITVGRQYSVSSASWEARCRLGSPHKRRRPRRLWCRSPLPVGPGSAAAHTHRLTPPRESDRVGRQTGFDRWRHKWHQCWDSSSLCFSVRWLSINNLVEMEDKPYSVDSSDDINIEEEEHVEENHSQYTCSYVVAILFYFYDWLLIRNC